MQTKTINNTIVKYQNIWIDSWLSDAEHSGEMWDTLEKATEIANKDLEISRECGSSLTLVRQEKLTMPMFGPIEVEVV